MTQINLCKLKPSQLQDLSTLGSLGGEFYQIKVAVDSFLTNNIESSKPVFVDVSTSTFNLIRAIFRREH